MITADAPLFVVGSGRSGTSLLRVMLNAHPNIHLTHEASFYLDPRGNGLADDGRAWFDRYARTFSFAFLGVPRSAVTDQLDTLAAPARRDAVAAVMRAAAAQRGKTRFGDKTPAHAQQLATIAAEHPGARFVHVVRDPRGVVASLAAMPWATSSHGLNAFFAAQQVKAIDRFATTGGAVCTVRLEDLVARPEDELRRVLDFVGEDWDTAVLDHTAHGGGSDLPPLPWFAEAARPVTAPTGPSETWPLSPAWIRRIERTASWTLRHHGYERDTTIGEPGAAERLATHAADAREVAASAARGARAATLTLRREPPPPDEALAAVCAVNPAAWDHYPGFSLPPVPVVAP
ncbi:MAG: sulfotransferase [Acidimicrobiales bacterium]|nr:sulfotransferase [Acidimicrobiales bacterium]